MDLPLPLVAADLEALIPFAAMMIPITALMIPIVAIWTAHRRKVLEMKLEAQVRMNQAGLQGQGEVQALRSEVRELREQLHAQVITMDSLISNQAKLLESPAAREKLRNRLGGDDKP